MSGGDLDSVAAGDYFAIFCVWISTPADQNGRINTFAIFVDGVEVASTTQDCAIASTVDSSGALGLCSGVISVDEGENVDVRHKANDGTFNGTMKVKSVILFPAPSGGITETANAADLAEDPGTSYVQVAGVDPDMTLTPGAGDYLVVYSASLQSDSAENLINHIITVDGTDRPDTEIWHLNEGSIDGWSFPFWTTDTATTDANDVIEIKYKNSAAATLTTHQRRMTLVKVASGDVFAAGGCADDTDITTDAKQIDDMIINNPGADTYMTIFGSSLRYGSRGEVNTAYSVFEGATPVEEAESIREHHFDASVDDAELPVMTISDPTTSTASDDLLVYWKGSSIDSRIAKPRNMTALREAAAAVDLIEPPLLHSFARVRAASY